MHYLSIYLFRVALLASQLTGLNAQGGGILDLLGKIGSGGNGGDIGGVIKDLLSGDKVSGLTNKNKCLANDVRPSATIGEITKGMSFYLDMESDKADELKRTASCLTDAYTPERANAGQICNPRVGVAPYYESLRAYMLACDDIVHYRVLRVNGGGDAKIGCVVNVNGRGMWANQNVNLVLNSATEADFDVVEGFNCGSSNVVQNLKIIAVQRRMCFATRNMIMNKDVETGEEDKKCDVTRLKLIADEQVRSSIIDCAVDGMNRPNESPNDAINKCTCFVRANYRRTVENCTSEAEEPDRCQDLEDASTTQKYSLGYLGSCLRSGGQNAFDKEERSELSCLVEIRTGRPLVDMKTVTNVRQFLIKCDQSILNHVFNNDDRCVYRVSGSADAKWDAPQSAQLSVDLGSNADSDEVVEVKDVFECPNGNKENPVNQRRANQNRQLLNLWRSSCNLAFDLLSGPAENCNACKFAVLQRLVPELKEAKKPKGDPSTLDDYAKNVFDCVRKLMDSWYTDLVQPFEVCLDKELDGIKPELCQN